MQRKRDGLIPIAEVFGSLDDVPTIRDASPQARRGFTRFDQVRQLVGAREAEAETGFMARPDGTVLAASLESRQPPPVQARQRSLHAHHVGHRG